MFNLKIAESKTTLESLTKQINFVQSDLDANITDKFRSMLNLKQLDKLKKIKETLTEGSSSPGNQ